jgi:hypothetical protein
MGDHVPRMLERGAGMKESVEIENVVVKGGRRPHGCLQIWDELRGGRAGKVPRGVDRSKTSESGSGGFGFDLGDVVRGGAVDLDEARLHRLGDFPLKVDDQQAVLELRALDLDVVGQRELALEVAS